MSKTCSEFDIRLFKASKARGQALHTLVKKSLHEIQLLQNMQQLPKTVTGNGVPVRLWFVVAGKTMCGC